MGKKKEVAKKAQLTLEEIFRLEPALYDLEKDILKISSKGKKVFCANAHWYNYAGNIGYRGLMIALVGFNAREPALRTMHSYDLVYEHLYQLLPNCKNCGCW